MTQKIYNTLSGKKEDFEPMEANRVTMYVCGVTVYDLCHIGHARGAVFFDVMRKYLEQQGREVVYVRNFTDIDDKIIKRSQEAGVTAKELADKYIEEYKTDMGALGVKEATIEPKATEHMDEIIRIVAGLEKKGIAYEADGDVYFSVNNFMNYGKLSNRNLDEMLVGTRIEVNPLKRHPLDFALWKSSKPGEPSWDSPWGFGRPGWHIECSAMSMKYLGDTFDIHGGGKDLIFPHHENEIAQSEGLTGLPLANYWVHNGFISINAEKMSKSLGNFFTIKEVLAKYPAEVVRFFLLSTHYRSPIDFSDAALDEAEKSLDRIYNALENAETAMQDQEAKIDLSHPFLKNIEKLQTDFKAAMEDDFNTALALAAVFDLVRELNTLLSKSNNTPQDIWIIKIVMDEIKKIGLIFGLFSGREAKGLDDVADKLNLLLTELQPNDDKKDWSAEDVLDEIIKVRIDARNNKDWAAADLIRDRLIELEIEIKDSPKGTSWKLK